MILQFINIRPIDSIQTRIYHWCKVGLRMNCIQVWWSKLKWFGRSLMYMWPLMRKCSSGMNARQAHGWETDSQAVWNGMAKWMQRRRTFLYGWRKFLQGCSQMDTRLTKIFEQMCSKGWIADKNFWTDERLKKIFLNRCDRANERLNKIIILERMRVISQTTKENYNTIILEQAPLQLYKNEQINHFLFWKLIDFRNSDTVLKFIVSRIKQICSRLRQTN